MNTSRFLNHLRKEMPAWKAQGWVSDENSQAILNHVEDQASKANFLAYAIAILGVLLLAQASLPTLPPTGRK